MDFGLYRRKSLEKGQFRLAIFLIELNPIIVVKRLPRYSRPPTDLVYFSATGLSR